MDINRKRTYVRHSLLDEYKKNMTDDVQSKGGGVFWLTGLPCSGKSTLAFKVKRSLAEKDIGLLVLDSSVMRGGMCADLGFSMADRSENIKRVANISKIFASKGSLCLSALITPLEMHRRLARSIIGRGFYEIFLSCPVDVCEARDVCGNYRKARTGQIPNFTGISSEFEIPLNPDLVVRTDIFSEDYCVKAIHNFILKQSRSSNNLWNSPFSLTSAIHAWKSTFHRNDV